MARQTLPPFFTGTAQSLTFYRMYGRYYARAKSTLSAERVKSEACFAPTRWQASVMARASKIGSAAYAAIPLFCREYHYYRLLTGKANLLLKQGWHEDEILLRLIDKYVIPLRKASIKQSIRKRSKEKRKRNRTVKPAYLRRHRGLKMVEWDMNAIDRLVNVVLEKLPEKAPPVAA